jgi:hypothetical protein
MNLPFEILTNIIKYVDIKTRNNIPYKLLMFYDHYYTKWHEIPYTYCFYCNKKLLKI